MKTNPGNAASRAIWVAGCAAALLILMAATRPESTTVGVVDPDRIRTDSTTIVKQLLEASAPAQKIQGRLKARQGEYQKALEAYQAQQSILSEASRKEREGQLTAMGAEVQKLTAEFNEAFSQAEQTQLDPMRDRIRRAVAAVARRRGMQVVVPFSGVVYFDPETDLTAAVIAELDKEGGR